jgi:hypothetical protein
MTFKQEVTHCFRNADSAWCGAAILLVLFMQGAFAIWADTPLWLYGDHVFILSPARQMMDWQGFWSSDIIGYPLGQKSTYWPGFEPLLKSLLWLVARLGLDVFATVKTFYILAISFLVASGYVCLRVLGVRDWLAAIGAVSFAVSPYFAMRAANHDFLSIYASAAFGCTLALLICRLADEAGLIRLIRSRFFVLGILIVSTCGLYYAFFSLLMIAVAMLGLAARVQKWGPLLILAGLGIAVVGLLLLGGLGPQILTLLSFGPRREAVEQLRHGLSISDAIYSFDWLPGARHFVGKYDHIRATSLIGEGRAEWPGTLTTLVILASPLLAYWGVSNSKLDRRWADIPIAAMLICVGLIFASRGGVGFLFNELITPAIRGQARIMPLLMFLATFIVLAASDLLLQEPGWARRACVGSVCGALLLSGYASAGQLTWRQKWVAADPIAQALRTSFAQVEAAKDRTGMSAILQLPIISWPEAPFRNGFDSYTHHFGYIFDKRGSKTKWSYGSSDLQPGFFEMRATLRSKNDPAGLASRARKYGFDGLLIEKKPFSARELVNFLGGVASRLPEQCKLFEDDARVLYDIGRAAECRVDSDPEMAITSDFQRDGEDFAVKGFTQSTADGIRALENRADLVMPTPDGSTDLTLQISFDMDGVTAKEKRLMVLVNDATLGTFDIDVTRPVKDRTIVVSIPRSLVKRDGTLAIALELQDPNDAAALKRADSRKLELLLKSIVISR